MAVKYFTIYNGAISGFIAGTSAGKAQINAPGDASQVAPANFAAQLAAAQLFAAEVDAILQLDLSPPANLAALVSAGATVVPANASVANAAQSLPPAMSAMASALWNGRTLPTDAVTGLPFTQADYQPMANAVAQQFLEFCTGCDTL